MSRSVIGVYAGAFGLGLVLSLLLTPFARRLALRRDILDHPRGYKAQKAPVPYLGGAVIVVAFCVVITLAALMVGTPEDVLNELVTVLGVGVALSLLGLFDDVRGGLSPWVRLAFQGAAGFAMTAVGVSFGLFANDLVNAVITILWLVGITNAFNLLDNMDGLSAGVAAIAASFFCAIAVVNEQMLVAPLAAALAGCALGFLPSNFHPARIYMGDAGSLFLGFMLAVLGVKLSLDAAAGTAALFAPLLILGVAIFDTSLVVITRLLNGRNPLRGGRDHLSHRLVFIGLPVRSAVAVVYVTVVALGCLSFIIARLDVVIGWLITTILLLVAFVLGALLARVPVYAQPPPTAQGGADDGDTAQEIRPSGMANSPSSAARNDSM